MNTETRSGPGAKHPEPPFEITAVHVTTWNHDQWTGGPYSTLGVGGRPHHRGDLAEPIDGRLVFAGEHTSVDFPATMHGAFNSGVLAATRLKEAHRAGTATVIGAGISGLAAARQLTLAGWSVRVVEATDRIGGRARTDHLDSGLTIHPGAAWIHGPLGNPIATIADTVGMSGIDNWPQHQAAVRLGAAADATRWLSHEAMARINEAASVVMARLTDRADAARAAGDLDIAMREPLRQELAAITDPMVRAGVKVVIDLHFESLMAADLDQLSLQHGDEPYAYPGGDRYLATPLQPVIDFLTTGLDITLNCAVERVNMRTDDQGHSTGMKIDLRSGETIHSDVCVVTIPLGALQGGSVVFEPELPHDHRHALAHLRMGHKCKVFAAFDLKWWGDIEQLWVYPASESPAGSAADPAAPTQWGCWVDTTEPCGQPVLCGFLGGAAATRVQAQFVSEGVEGLRNELTKLFTPIARAK